MDTPAPGDGDIVTSSDGALQTSEDIDAEILEDGGDPMILGDDAT